MIMGVKSPRGDLTRMILSLIMVNDSVQNCFQNHVHNLIIIAHSDHAYYTIV